MGAGVGVGVLGGVVGVGGTGVGVGVAVGTGSGVDVGSWTAVGVGSGGGVGEDNGDGVAVGEPLPGVAPTMVTGAAFASVTSTEQVPSISSKAVHSAAVAVRSHAAFTFIQLTAYSHR